MQALPKAVEDSRWQLHSCTWEKDKVWCDWKALVQSLRLTLESKTSDSQLRKLLNECMALYRASCAIPPTTDNLLASISGINSSLLEAAFMWLGGWRPSSAVTLVYSKMGVSVGKCDGLAGFITPSCMLSKSQLSAMEALRDQTGKAEAEISSSLASVQMLLADQNMTEAFGIGSPPYAMQAPSSGSDTVEAHRLMDRKPSSGSDTVEAQRLMNSKLTSLRSLYMQANGLRLHTLQELLNLLTPTQAGQCAVAAFELANALRSLGDAFAFKMRSDQSELTRASFKHAA